MKAKYVLMLFIKSKRETEIEMEGTTTRQTVQAFKSPNLSVGNVSEDYWSKQISVKTQSMFIS